MAEISGNRGVLYDARVVDACLAVVTAEKFRVRQRVGGHRMAAPVRGRRRSCRGRRTNAGPLAAALPHA